MELDITDNYTLKEIQQEFRSHYPFLKIEFFRSPSESSESQLKENLITEVSKTIGEIRHMHSSGHLSINGQQKVSTLEKNFSGYYGLNVQVFWKMGKLWVKTTTSDTLSLSELNKKAEDYYKEEQELASGERPEIDYD